MRFSFVHAADLHLDTPFEGLSRVSTEAASFLRDASLGAFDAIVRLAIERSASFVLLAGDLYDGEERGVRAQLRLLRGIEALAGHGIQTFIVHGNHDPLRGWSAIRRWPAGVTIFGSEEVVGVPVEVSGHRLATVFGLSYSRREINENLSLRFPRSAAPGSEMGLKIGLLHCSVGDQPEHSPYAPCSLADLRRADIDYWALGHIHRLTVLQEGLPWIVYPGNTQGRSPKPAESGVKGVAFVEAEGSFVRSLEVVPVDLVRFLEVRLDVAALGECADVGALRSVLMQKAAALQEENRGRALLLRVVLEGRGALHRDLAFPGTTDDLIRELQEAWSDANPSVWWEGVRDHSRPEIDVDGVRAGDDFAANLLALADAAARDPARRDELVRLLSPDSPADLIRRCGAPTHEQVVQLLEEGSLLALEALEKESPTCA
jgi:DNA repair exonuclease SbcCD nuclease subunit